MSRKPTQEIASQQDLAIFQQITETVPGMIALYNIHTGQYIYVNNAIKKILGFKPEDFTKKGLSFVSTLVHPDDIPDMMAKNTLALKLANSRKNPNPDSEPIVNFEYRMKGKDGRYRWLHTDGSVFSRNSKGQVESVLNISIDITARKEAEAKEEQLLKLAEALKNSEEMLRLALDASKLGAWDWDIPNNKVSWTDKVYQMHGLKIGQFGGTVEDFAKLLHPEDAPRMWEAIQKAVKNVSRFSGEFRVIWPNGNIRWLFTEGRAFPGKDGKAVRMLGATFDITNRKEGIRQLQLSEQQFRTLTSLAPVGIFQTDAEGNCIFINKRWSKIAGLSFAEAKGQGWSKALHPEDKDRVFKEWYQAAKNKQPFSSIYRFQTPQGKVTWLDGEAIGLKDESGKIIGFLGTITDISEQKKLMEQKDEFIGIASHELKTPVTSIKGYTQVLKFQLEQLGEKKWVQYLSKMDAQLDKLTNLIGDLLDVTKIEAGKMVLSKDHFAFDELVKEIVDEMQLTTDRHQIILKNEAHKKITGDRERIGQVMTNFISNAIKYSPKVGKIIVESSLKQDQVVLSVKDFGIGMNKEHQSKVFERFYRVSGPNNQTFPGLGLGLYISSEIIKRMGGRIWVESARGKGSTFYFSLPTSKKAVNQKSSQT